MQDQNDPSRVFMLVVFESEEKARARENDPRRQEGLQAARATMAEIFDGAPEFVDLTHRGRGVAVGEREVSAGRGLHEDAVSVEVRQISELRSGKPARDLVADRAGVGCG